MPEGRVTTRDGVGLSYREAGSGHPLVMIPGWSQTAAAFGRQIDALAATARVIALDMRGHGESEKPENGYRIQRLAKDLFDVLAALDLEQPDVLGHSMGCSVIWSYLSLFQSDRPLRRLVLVDQAPAALAQPGWDEATRSDAGCLFGDAGALAGFEASVLAARDEAAIKEVLRGMFTPTLPEADLDWFAAENAKLPRQHAAHLVHDHCVLDWRSQIRTITNPTLVVGGEASVFSAASQRWIAAQIPGAEVDVFGPEEGGSHFMFWENPDRFNDRVVRFLQA